MKTLLKNAREQKGLKTREVAQLLHIDQALISKFENGLRKPTREQLSKLAALLEIDFETLLVAWLKEKILYEIGQDEYALKAIQLAEEEIKFNAFQKAYPISARLQLLLNEIDNLKEKADRFRQFETEKVTRILELEYTFESNQLEGNTLSLDETSAVLFQGLTIAGKSMREHLETINHQEAIRHLKQLVERNGALSEKDLLSLHNMIIRGIHPEASGKYRTEVPNTPESAYIPPAPALIQKQIADSFMWYETNKNKLHPVVLAAEMLEQLLSIQPFLNGNGKVARLFMNFILLQNGFVVANIKGNPEYRMLFAKICETAALTKDKEPLLVFIALAEKESLERYLNVLVQN